MHKSSPYRYQTPHIYYIHTLPINYTHDIQTPHMAHIFHTNSHTGLPPQTTHNHTNTTHTPHGHHTHTRPILYARTTHNTQNVHTPHTHHTPHTGNTHNT